MPRLPLEHRLLTFMEKYVSNPAVRLELVQLFQAVKDHPTHDHADYDLVEFLEEQQKRLRALVRK